MRCLCVLTSSRSSDAVSRCPSSSSRSLGHFLSSSCRIWHSSFWLAASRHCTCIHQSEERENYELWWFFTLTWSSFLSKFQQQKSTFQVSWFIYILNKLWKQFDWSPGLLSNCTFLFQQFHLDCFCYDLKSFMHNILLVCKKKC